MLVEFVIVRRQTKQLLQANKRALNKVARGLVRQVIDARLGVLKSERNYD